MVERTDPTSAIDALEVEERPGGALAVCFKAMASPCELLVHTTDRAEALKLGAVAAGEAWRVENRYSRYRDDSVLSWIHRHRGSDVCLDEETAALLEFARHCFEMSDGLFDITSGVLRRAWKFDGSQHIPAAAAVDDLLPFIGFRRLQWRSPRLMLPAGMELDFGGIGKEYAVDRAYDLVAAQTEAAFLVNFGGDLRANKPPPQGRWQIGIERPDTERAAAMMLELKFGALATSGDTHRFLLADGVRYGHILDPRTGWPIVGSPRSVTTAASSCTEAGLLSTVAMLHGEQAETFLEQQGNRFWILR